MIERSISGLGALQRGAVAPATTTQRAYIKNQICPEMGYLHLRATRSVRRRDALS
jgi:hypothetical protein